MKDFTKGLILGGLGYVGLKIIESGLAAAVDAASTVLGAASEFYVYDGQQERGIEAEDECGCMPQIGFEIPSEPVSELEEEEEDAEEHARFQVGFR